MSSGRFLYRVVDMMDTSSTPRAVQQVGHPEDATNSIPDLPRSGGIILVCASHRLDVQ
jgi:hypothetical protein